MPIEPRRAATYLTTVLRLLNHAPPPELEYDTPARVLAWAVRNWRLEAFKNLRSVTAGDTPHAK